MPVIVVEGRFCVVRLSLAPTEIPGLLHSHSQAYPGAEDCERIGQSLVESDFESRKAGEFVRAVLKWGGGLRLTRKLASNSKEEIGAALRDGYALALKGDVCAGVERIRKLNGLGQSFASKMLRFLAPSAAVILDGVIRSDLGYRDTSAGYGQFLDDCNRLHDLVRESDHLDEQVREALRICDIEAAIFAKLQGY